MDNSVENEKSFVRKVAALTNHKSDECPVCGARVEHLVKIDEHVHAQPCDCRLWQGNVPAKWWGRQPGSV